jgi:hypothetical protein
MILVLVSSLAVGFDGILFDYDLREPLIVAAATAVAE